MSLSIIKHAAFIYWEMEMSRITNSNIPKRGEQLTSTDLNQVFTDVNNAFPLDGQNFRSESLDQPQFSLNSSHGKSGIILVAAGSNESTTPVTVDANTGVYPSFDLPEILQTYSVVQPVQNDQMIRVYWQFDFENTVSDVSPVDDPDNNGLIWAVWLEYKTGPLPADPWQAVPNQHDFAVPIDGTIGSPTAWGCTTAFAYGCTVYNHAFVHAHSSTTEVDTPPHRTGYGCWWYTPDSTWTAYGFRLMCRGLMDQRYVSAAGFIQGNAFQLLTISSGTQQTTINNNYLAYMVMRKQ